MKRLFFLIGLAGLLFAGGDARSGPVAPFPTEESDMLPVSSRNFTLEFRGGKRAVALAIGDKQTYMGLYIYDAQGNCVAWDDQGNFIACDVLFVDWTPAQNGFYTIEVHNAGYQKNKCRLLVR
jgi:hypothetical protein